MQGLFVQKDLTKWRKQAQLLQRRAGLAEISLKFCQKETSEISKSSASNAGTSKSSACNAGTSKSSACNLGISKSSA